MRGITQRWLETEKLFETELENSLRLLKLNRENVPEEELRTRYRKKYARLKDDVSKLAEEYVKLHITCGIFFREQDRKAVTDAINRTIAESGITKQISEAAFGKQDMQAVRRLADRLRKLVWKNTQDWRLDGSTGESA